MGSIYCLLLVNDELRDGDAVNVPQSSQMQRHLPLCKCCENLVTLLDDPRHRMLTYRKIVRRHIWAGVRSPFASTAVAKATLCKTLVSMATWLVALRVFMCEREQDCGSYYPLFSTSRPSPYGSSQRCQANRLLEGSWQVLLAQNRKQRLPGSRFSA